MMWGNNPYYLSSCGANWAGQLISLAVTILVIVILIKLAIRFMRSDGHGGHGGRGPWWNSAESQLKERFVKGEISKEEYQEKLKVIRE